MKHFATPLYIAGLVLVLLGLIAYFPMRSASPYCLIVGGLLLTWAQYIIDVSPRSRSLRRLYMQRQISHLLLFVSGCLMLFLHNNEWIAAVTIAALVQFYTAFRIPVVEKQEQGQGQ